MYYYYYLEIYLKRENSKKFQNNKQTNKYFI